MVKLKKYKVKKLACPTCKGNGYIKVSSLEHDEMIHQCWDCDSEGEFYVYEPPMATSDDADNGDGNTNDRLH